MPYNMGEYYERVSDYDLEYQSQSEQDIPFWCELVMRYTPERVLELACGSGRIGIELLHSSRTYDQIEQLQHIVWTHEKFFEAGENERYLTRLDMHVFFPRELQLLFLATGFSIEAIYGGYDWKPLGKGTRQIVVGRKQGRLGE